MADTLLRPGLSICLTGKMPLKRDELIRVLEACGLRYVSVPARAHWVVYAADAREERTSKYRDGESRGTLLEVGYFFEQLRGWDPTADDLLEEYLG
jgi:hypothetical protein